MTTTLPSPRPADGQALPAELRERWLEPEPGREVQALDGVAPLEGAGIRFIAVDHEGHTGDSEEEAATIVGMITSVLNEGARWTDADGTDVPLTLADILVVTPYDSQVRTIREAMPGVRVGTVDKFQGQQGPVSIYSMATSSADEAPRGMEFLYSLHRLNVATSRARCIALVVASPHLLRVRCRTPRQMRLANALARFVELSAG